MALCRQLKSLSALPGMKTPKPDGKKWERTPNKHRDTIGEEKTIIL